MDELWAKAASQGLGYLMFVVLFAWVLRKQEIRDAKSEEREKTLREIIANLTCDVSLKLDKLLDRER